MSIALCTIAQDETTALQLWVTHHTICAPTAHLYILDHESRGDSARLMRQLSNDDNVTVIPVRHADSFDYNWLTRTVEDFIVFLLRSFDVVGFCEVDELLHTPNYVNIDAFVADKKDVQFHRATSKCIVHHYPQEPDINWSKPWIAQRLRWYSSQRYSKVALMRRPVYFKNGFHGTYNVGDILPDPELWCLHTHQADFATTMARHRKNAGRIWCGDSRKSECGMHQRLDNPEKVSKYLLCDLDNPFEYAQTEDIPQSVKDSYKICLQSL